MPYQHFHPVPTISVTERERIFVLIARRLSKGCGQGRIVTAIHRSCPRLSMIEIRQLMLDWSDINSTRIP